MYYNQRDYANVPYPHAAHPNATVKSGGCGVVCASMIVEAFHGDKTFPPDKSAAFSIACGARASTGTDMQVLGKEIAASYSLTYATTLNTNDLTEHLKNGGWAIANITGDRSGYKAIFCTTGHYVVVRGLTSDGRAIVWDPDYYNGKFNINGRASRVELHYPDVYVTIDNLAKDTQGRYFYLFNMKKEEKPVADDKNTVSDWAKESVEKAVNKGILLGDENGNLYPQDPVTREQFCVILDRLGLLD